jgi:hypothetical protein
MAERVAGEQGDPAAPHQFAWAEERLIAEHLQAGGFTEHHVEALDFTMGYRSAADWWEAQLSFSSFFARAVARANDSQLAELREAVDRHAEDFSGADGRVRIPARTWVAWAAA